MDFRVFLFIRCPRFYLNFLYDNKSEVYCVVMRKIHKFWVEKREERNVQQKKIGKRIFYQVKIYIVYLDVVHAQHNTQIQTYMCGMFMNYIRQNNLFEWNGLISSTLAQYISNEKVKCFFFSFPHSCNEYWK